MVLTLLFVLADIVAEIVPGTAAEIVLVGTAAAAETVPVGTAAAGIAPVDIAAENVLADIVLGVEKAEYPHRKLACLQK